MNQSVKKFREEQHKPQTITAPSGQQYVVQRLTIMDYIKEGLTDIPNDFFRFVLELTSGKKLGISEEDELKNYELFEKYLAVTVAKGIIDPPTILRWEMEKQDTHLLWGEVPTLDQEYIIGCITGRIKDEPSHVEPEPKAVEAQESGAPTE